jgi:hypothetical protein
VSAEHFSSRVRRERVLAMNFVSHNLKQGILFF